MYPEAIQPARDKNEVIPGHYLCPRSTDKRFSAAGGALIYLASELTVPQARELTFDTKDRLQEWFSQEHYAEVERRVAAEYANQPGCAAYFEAVLRTLYHSPSLELQAIRTGVESRTAFPWMGFACNPRPLPMLFSTF